MIKPLASTLLACALAAAQQTPAKPAPESKKPDTLQELSQSLESLSRRVSRSVVQIFATGYSLSDESEGGNAAVVTRQKATGSGAIVSADGYIVTNRHVVANARVVKVRLLTNRSGNQHSIIRPAGKLLDARIVGVDRDTDLAVIKIDGKDLPHLVLGDSDRLRQGQLVMAFGNPLGLDNSVSLGVVSSVGRQIHPDDTMVYIQTDAPINPGNSGGPLVDAEGHVVGINTFILSQSGGSEGLGFAIPSNIVKSVYPQIRREGHVHRGSIGVFGQTITDSLASGLGLAQDWGAILADVDPEGPADQAGLKVGDIVLSLDGKTIENARQLTVNLYRYRVGEKVKLEILRGKEKLTYTVAVAVQEGDEERFADMVDPTKNLVPELGILAVEIDKNVAEMLPDIRKQYGVVVAARAGDSVFSSGSLEVGDVIYTVNTEPVTSIQALRNALHALQDSESVVLQIERDGRMQYLTLETE